MHLVETVAAHVETVTALAQIGHQTARARNEAWFGGAKVEEAVARGQAELARRLQALAQTERTAKALHDEVVAGDFSARILRPEQEVLAPIGIKELLRAGEIALEALLVKQFAQGDVGIAMRIVEGIVEIDEEVGVGHGDSRYRRIIKQ